MTRVVIRDCMKQGFRFPKIVAYDERNQRWMYFGRKIIDARQRSALIAKVREAGSIDPTYWRNLG